MSNHNIQGPSASGIKACVLFGMVDVLLFFFMLLFDDYINMLTNLKESLKESKHVKGNIFVLNVVF